MNDNPNSSIIKINLIATGILFCALGIMALLDPVATSNLVKKYAEMDVDPAILGICPNRIGCG